MDYNTLYIDLVVYTTKIRITNIVLLLNPRYLSDPPLNHLTFLGYLVSETEVSIEFFNSTECLFIRHFLLHNKQSIYFKERISFTNVTHFF